MSDIGYPDYTLDKFSVLGITGNIKGVTVEAIKEFNYSKGQACKVLLKDKTGEKWLSIWKSEENLSFKKGDIISISQVESNLNERFNNIDLKLSNASEIFNSGTWSKSIDYKPGDPAPSKHLTVVTPGPKTQTVNMPHNPNTIESEFIFYPAFDYPRLRQMHAKEPEFAVRAQIELVMQNKQILDAIIRVGDILKEMMNK